MNTLSRLFVIAVIAVCASSLAAPQPDTLFGLGSEVLKKIPDSVLFVIDPDTGATTPVGNTGFPRCTGLDFHPSTNVPFAVCVSEELEDFVLITINPGTGAGTLVGNLNTGPIVGDVTDISFRSDGTLFAYISNKPNDILGIIDTDTGNFTQVGDTGIFFGIGGIAFSLADVLFFTGLEGLPIGNGLFILNQDNGDSTLVTGLNFPPPDRRDLIQSADTRPSNGVLYIADRIFPTTVLLSTVDVDSGNVTEIGQMDENIIMAIAFTNPIVRNVPTLSQYGLMLAAVVLLAAALLILKRRRTSSQT